MLVGTVDILIGDVDMEMEMLIGDVDWEVKMLTRMWRF